MSDESEAQPSNEDYRVGYKCPPKEHRFQDGKSGNPTGKRNKDLGCDAPFTKALKRKRAAKIGHIRKLLRMDEFIAERIVEDAARGNLAAAKLAFSYARSESKETFDYSILTDTEIAELERLLVKCNMK